MNVGFIGDMFRYTFMAKMNMTNFTIHRGHGILTQGAAHDILSATPGIHDHLNFNLKMKEIQIKEKKIIKNGKSSLKQGGSPRPIRLQKNNLPYTIILKMVNNTKYMYTVTLHTVLVIHGSYSGGLTSSKILLIY